MTNALFIFGTRPEAIKLCPVVDALRKHPDYRVSVCVTAQHRALLDQVLAVFQVRPDHDLNVMTPGQTLFQSTSRITAALEPVIEREQPDVVLVQGDTTTTFCGALAGFYKRIPVAHIEAGLRTGDRYQPFPEEMNRLLAGRLASIHFAATPWAADNLRREGVEDGSIHVTGNTGIDAVLHVARGLERGAIETPELPKPLDASKKLIVVTTHRRESFGGGLESTCRAIRRLASRPDTQIVFPVHPNPNVRATVDGLLRGVANVTLCEPLSYVPFVDLMRRAWLLLTDSGGIQEEGPSLGKPILVLREKTERPEAVEAGTVRLVGTGEERIVAHASELLDDAALYESMAQAHNPYGDGAASGRIAAILAGAVAGGRAG
ncbi:MAG: UDP-N-acetylglucosamine 2-epimerase (non-hydrolyzing) [Bryobacteraceae bacterium]